MVRLPHSSLLPSLTVRTGQFIAVGWSDGTVRLMGLENNKAAYSIRVSGDADTRITHIGWSCNHIGRPHTTRSKPEPDSWQELLSKELDLGKDGAPLDLPKELTFLEVETALPKISPLPSASAGEGFVAECTWRCVVHSC